MKNKDYITLENEKIHLKAKIKVLEEKRKSIEKELEKLKDNLSSVESEQLARVHAGLYKMGGTIK